jgi:hypothetical protein
VGEAVGLPVLVSPEGLSVSHQGPGNLAGYCDPEVTEGRKVEDGADEAADAGHVDQGWGLPIETVLETAERLKAARESLNLLVASEEMKSETPAGMAGEACSGLKLSGRQE